MQGCWAAGSWREPNLSGDTVSFRQQTTWTLAERIRSLILRRSWKFGEDAWSFSQRNDCMTETASANLSPTTADSHQKLAIVASAMLGSCRTAKVSAAAVGSWSVTGVRTSSGGGVGSRNHNGSDPDDIQQRTCDLATYLTDFSASPQGSIISAVTEGMLMTRLQLLTRSPSTHTTGTLTGLGRLAPRSADAPGTNGRAALNFQLASCDRWRLVEAWYWRWTGVSAPLLSRCYPPSSNLHLL